MKHRGRLHEVVRRAENGPMVEEQEFEKKLITAAVSRLIKKYGIKFNRDTVVPADDDLADRLYQAGLDSRICGEVAHAATGMSREEANEIVKQLTQKYESGLKDEPSGKPFEEVYDLETITPIAEWQGLYDEVKTELMVIGLPIH